MNEVDPNELKQAVEAQHGGIARLVETIPVRDEIRGKLFWEGVVHVFDLASHPSATRAYAWSTLVDQKTRKFYAVLETEAIKTPLDAVRAGIAAELEAWEIPFWNALGELGAYAVGDSRTEEDLLCLMILFHTHRFEFKRPISPGRDVLGLAALTTRGAAAVAAYVWPDKADSRRSDYAYWYNLFYDRRVSLEAWEEVPADLAAKTEVIKERLLTHPNVTGIEVED